MAQVPGKQLFQGSPTVKAGEGGGQEEKWGGNEGSLWPNLRGPCISWALLSDHMLARGIT